MVLKKLFVAGLLSAFGLAQSVFPVQAEIVENIEKFDSNNDGQIDQNEWSVLVKHIGNDPIYRNLDKDRDGEITLEEFQVQLKQANLAAEVNSGSFYKRAKKGKPTIPINVVRERWGLKQNKKTSELPFNIRQSVAGLSLGDKPAVFSYLHDFGSGNDVWSATGALIFPIERDVIGDRPPPEGFYLDSYIAAFALSFSHLSNRDDQTKDIDMVGFHGDVEFDISGGPFTAQYFTIDAAITTDYQLNSAILSADFDWQPVIAPIALNSIHYFGEKIGVRGLGVARLQVGTVLDPGNNTNLAKSEFARIGGELGLDLYLGESFLQGRWLHANINWKFFQNLRGKMNFDSLLEASINYYPAGNPNFGFNIKYLDGTIPLVQSRTQQITAGLSIKM